MKTYSAHTAQAEPNAPAVKVQKLHLEVRELLLPPTLRLELLSQIFHVSVGAEPRIIGKIPADMIGIFVDRELIAGPVPSRHNVVILRDDVPVVLIEPETFPVSPPRMNTCYGPNPPLKPPCARG